MAQITSFQLSALWVETNLALTEIQLPPQGMSFLARYQPYTERFENAQHHVRVHQPLTLSTPWPKTRGQHFWTYYLSGQTNVNVSSRKAWRSLVPFRAKLPVTTTTELDGLEADFDLFFYPHAVAFVASLLWQGETDVALAEMVQQAFALRRNPIYNITWLGNQIELFQTVPWQPAPYPTLTLNQLADASLAVARYLAYGLGIAPGRRTNVEPFTVISVLVGNDVNLEQAPAPGSDIHRALHTLTNWRDLAPAAAVPTLDERVVVGLGQEAGPADLLYGQTRGRAVWYPSRFTSYDDRSLNAVACYHHNLTLASLQTESLCGLAAALAERYGQGRAFTSYQTELARHAGGVLGRLYGGHPDTYRSRSPRLQIVHNGWVDAINVMRNQISDVYMAPLH